jgi:hypothetical protein
MDCPMIFSEQVSNWKEKKTYYFIYEVSSIYEVLLFPVGFLNLFYL